MFCRYCGAQNPDGAKFCQKCGKPAGPSPSVNQPAARVQPAAKAASSAPRNTAGTAAASAKKPAAAKPSPRQAVGTAAAKKAGGGLIGKIAAVALVGTAATVGVNMLMDDGGGGGHDGGGTGYRPPVTATPNSSGGSIDSGREAVVSGDSEYFLWQMASPDEGGMECLLVRIYEQDGRSVMEILDRDGEADEEVPLGGSVSGGSFTITQSDDGDHSSASFRRNSDGSWDGMMSYSGEDGSAQTYGKFTPLIRSGSDWLVVPTGELLNYDQIYYENTEGTEIGNIFLSEASGKNIYFQGYDTDDDPVPTYMPLVTPNPSTGNDVTIPDDVMQVYVTYEVENILHEFNGVKVPNHIRMPNSREQQRFEALIQDQLHGDELDFWLANKDDWY